MDEDKALVWRGRHLQALTREELLVVCGEMTEHIRYLMASLRSDDNDRDVVVRGLRKLMRDARNG